METVQGGGTEKSLNPPAWSSAQESSLASNSHQELENTGMTSEILLARSKGERKFLHVFLSAVTTKTNDCSIHKSKGVPRSCRQLRSFSFIKGKRKQQRWDQGSRSRWLCIYPITPMLLQLRGVPQLGKPVSSQPRFFSFSINISWKTSASEVPQSNIGGIFLDVVGAANIFKEFSIL